MSRTVLFSSVLRLATAFEMRSFLSFSPFLSHVRFSSPVSGLSFLRSIHPHPPVVPHFLPHGFFAKTFHVVCAKTGDSIVSSPMYVGKAVAVERTNE